MGNLEAVLALPFCDDCGAVIGNPDRHREWHAKLYRVAEQASSGFDAAYPQGYGR